jgi:hypothetical protein
MARQAGGHAGSSTLPAAGCSLAAARRHCGCLPRHAPAHPAAHAHCQVQWRRPLAGAIQGGAALQQRTSRLQLACSRRTRVRTQASASGLANATGLVRPIRRQRGGQPAGGVGAWVGGWATATKLPSCLHWRAQELGPSLPAAWGMQQRRQCVRVCVRTMQQCDMQWGALLVVSLVGVGQLRCGCLRHIARQHIILQHPHPSTHIQHPNT